MKISMIHCVNGLPHLLFQAPQTEIKLGSADHTTGTYDLERQKWFLDPLTNTPLYAVLDNRAIRTQHVPLNILSDKLLYDLLEISFIGSSDSKEEIKSIQNHPFFQEILRSSPHRNTIFGLYEIVEQMTMTLKYGPGDPLQSIADCLKPGYSFVCSGVTAIVAACLDAWDVPLRIGLGYGDNIQFTHEGQTYNYFMDDEPGFGANQHCWIEVYLNSEWILFDPTIYFNKFKNRDINNANLLQKYREVAIQKNIHSGLYQFVIADFMQLPYKKNFIKTLLMFSDDAASRASLGYLLTKTKDILHVHYSGSDKSQQVHEVIRYCRNHFRPFIYTQSNIDCETPYKRVEAAVEVITTDHRGHYFDRIVCDELAEEPAVTYLNNLMQKNKTIKIPIWSRK